MALNIMANTLHAEAIVPAFIDIRNEHKNCSSKGSTKFNSDLFCFTHRKSALMHWKNELGLLSTYRNLLVICIRGNWQDCAKEIVTVISSKFIKTTPIKLHDLAVMCIIAI